MKHRRIVLKLGTNTLCDADGLPDMDLIRALAAEIHHLRAVGHQFLIVSSGAIGMGRAALKLGDGPLDIAMRQACAAVGQHRLMQAWDDALKKHHVPVAQLLLTSHTFQKRSRYVDLHNCLEALLSSGVVPILNENDATSIEEIDAAFTDNDRLGALVAARIEADLYVILSDVPGLMNKPPQEPGAELVTQVPSITPDILAMAKGAGKRGRGGMESKLLSAKTLTESGVPVVIAYGRDEHVLDAILGDSPPGTWFDAVGRRDGMRRWLQAAVAQGRIEIDAGAAAALRDGNHLLPAGITGVSGEFAVESVVDIVHEGTSVARALSLFSSRDLDRAKGMQSDEARQVLGVTGSVNVTRKGRIELS